MGEKCIYRKGLSAPTLSQERRQRTAARNQEGVSQEPTDEHEPRKERWSALSNYLTQVRLPWWLRQ